MHQANQTSRAVGDFAFYTLIFLSVSLRVNINSELQAISSWQVENRTPTWSEAPRLAPWCCSLVCSPRASACSTSEGSAVVMKCTSVCLFTNEKYQKLWIFGVSTHGMLHLTEHYAIYSTEGWVSAHSLLVFPLSPDIMPAGEVCCPLWPVRIFLITILTA